VDKKKLFTLSEANEMLPQLLEELQELQALTNKLEEQYLKLEKQKAIQRRSGGLSSVENDPYFEIESRIDFMRMEAELLIENFARKGVQLKMIHPGLIDFPAVLNGEDILICWKQGEERITHYHGLHDGFIGRKLLPED
jgi:hypothetical protein